MYKRYQCYRPLGPPAVFWIPEKVPREEISARLETWTDVRRTARPEEDLFHIGYSLFSRESLNKEYLLTWTGQIEQSARRKKYAQWSWPASFKREISHGVRAENG